MLDQRVIDDVQVWKILMGLHGACDPVGGGVELNCAGGHDKGMEDFRQSSISLMLCDKLDSVEYAGRIYRISDSRPLDRTSIQGAFRKDRPHE